MFKVYLYHAQNRTVGKWFLRLSGGAMNHCDSEHRGNPLVTRYYSEDELVHFEDVAISHTEEHQLIR